MNNIIELNPISYIKKNRLNAIILSRKSFIAYIVPMVIWFIFWIISVNINNFLGLLVFLTGIYIILYLRSYALFIDNNGVWIFCGVFPWQIKFYGIEWINFCDSKFYQNFTSWASKSYTLRITHKYNDNIKLNYMHNGDKVALKINNVFLHKYSKP